MQALIQEEVEEVKTFVRPESQAMTMTLIRTGITARLFRGVVELKAKDYHNLQIKQNFESIEVGEENSFIEIGQQAYRTKLIFQREPLLIEAKGIVNDKILDHSNSSFFTE